MPLHSRFHSHSHSHSYTSADGAVYDGDLREGAGGKERHGKGVMTEKSGAVYDGE